MKPETLKKLSLTLFSLRPNSRVLFWHARHLAPFLVLAPLTPNGHQRFIKRMGKVAKRAPKGKRGVLGVLMLDEAKTPLLVGKGIDDAFLADFAQFCIEKRPKLPGLAAFDDLGVAEATLPMKDIDALMGLSPETLEVHRDPALWEALHRPTLASVSDTLAGLSPGESAWCCLRTPQNDQEPALLVQPVVHDPQGKLLRKQADALGGEGLVGLATVTDTGVFQMTSAEATPEALGPLPDWMVRHAEQYPALRLLVGATLAKTEPTGQIDEVYTSLDSWTGLAPYALPGTLVETAQVLTDLPVGQDAWAVVATGDRPNMSLLATADDPEGQAFAERLPALRARFEGQTVATGVLSRATETATVLTIDAAFSLACCQAIAELIEDHGERLPGLERLRQAKVVGTHNGDVKRIHFVDQQLAVQEQAIRLFRLEYGEQLPFWLLGSDRENLPLLVMGWDPQAIAQDGARWAVEVKAQHAVTGTLRRGPNGTFVWTTPGPEPKLPTWVNQWVERTAGAHAVLLRSTFEPSTSNLGDVS